MAKVPAYEERGLEYHDLCETHWLASEPDLFWGFWGGCFNVRCSPCNTAARLGIGFPSVGRGRAPAIVQQDYRDTEPHEGYRIIRRWRDRLFTRTETARQLARSLPDSEPSPNAPYDTHGKAGVAKIPPIPRDAWCHLRSHWRSRGRIRWCVLVNIVPCSCLLLVHCERRRPFLRPFQAERGEPCRP